jgi:hypothetical protein
MLFKQQQLSGIANGTVTLAFRKWAKPAVKRGTLHKTAIGMVEIYGIDAVDEDDITASDANRAGYKNREALLASFAQAGDGTIYRIKVRYHSDDPRIELRQQTKLTDEEWAKLSTKLMRMDSASNEGSWTHKVLDVLQKNPKKRAADLAEQLGYDKDWLKINIRKLKNLGLTISHEVGYELSPLGVAFLKRRA